MPSQPKSPRERSLDTRKRRLRLTNHFFLLTAVLFVIHQNVFRDEVPAVEVPIVAQALNAQPQLPPPGVDPEDVSHEEVDLSQRPDERLVSPRFARSGEPATRD